MLRRFLSFFGLLVLSSLSAESVTTHAPIVEIGVEGLTKVEVTARNNGTLPIACGAAIAHWYSVDIGRAALGDTVRVTVWYDAARGAVFLLNTENVRLPIETLWCGVEGRSWETRAVVPLRNQAGEKPGPISLDCAESRGRLHCH
ncbi:hypothetical protein BH10PSE7_BH10PSE7_05780 [soil metagenome]